MKYNKGFAPLVVLLIVVGVLAVGGVAYFAGKSSAPKNEVADNSNYFPTTEQNYTPPTTNNNPPQQQIPPPVTQQQQTPPTPTCNPSITVLSPNGGQVYQSGQQITVTWSTCGATVNDQVMIIMKSTQTSFGAEIATVPNTGSATITLPTSLGGGQVPVTSGHYYKIRLELGGNAMGHTAPSDESNNLFTININQQTACAPNDPPSITVTNPTANAVYNVGQQVNVTWTSCNVDKVLIGWGQGGHDGGLFSETPITTSLGIYYGTYQWTVPSYQGVQGSHWIAVNQAIAQPNNNWTTGIFAKSGTFTIQ